MLSEEILSFILLGVFVCVLLFAFVAGGRTEKLGVAIAVANVVIGILGRLVGGAEMPVYFSLILDLSTAVAFGVIAVRNPEKLWPGVAGVAMTFVMVFSATRAVGFPLSETAYTAALNLSSLLVQASLFAGAWSHRWGRKRAEGELLPA